MKSQREAQEEQVRLQLWAEDSNAGEDLERALQEAGFQVERFYAESSKPVVIREGVTFAGYEQIFWNFLDPTSA
ncbi:MAG: hypothetical protein IH936_04865 [Acidobacteria bacterium]|nr:hypothetical protein [Acidobacteriota bacterium]